jgi:VCBS repeat-containing protein
MPEPTADAGLHPITEVLNTTGSTKLDIAPDVTLTFTQLNLSAVSASLASITWSGGATLPRGLSAVLAGALSVAAESAGTSGSITATFAAPDKDFDFLAANETLTVVYDVTATDTNGVSLTQPVMITITGSNDPPFLAADASNSQKVVKGLATTRTLTFTDVDLTDQHAVSTSVASATWSGVATLPSGLAAVLADALSSTTTDSMGSGSGSIALTFSAADTAFDFLAAGQTLTVIYNVTVSDEGGVSSTQPVTITIIGTNNTPVITSTSQNSAVTEHTNVDNRAILILAASSPSPMSI